MAPVEVEAVQVYKEQVNGLLDRAAQIKPDKQIEPPLTEAVLGELIWQLPPQQDEIIKSLNPQTRLAAVEIAFREKFYHTVAATSINEPSFIDIWNLLDIVSIFSDNEQCEPGLIFWLIEELLDSQTIDGCRKVFDYLESRRERNIKKHFKQKSLVILRSCNELLRRLSRAEDTVFCGRVFIFMFQSFPLGDKSSVNLRGEFHTENVTSFDEISRPKLGDEEGDSTMTEGNEDTPMVDGAAAGTPQATGQENEGTPKLPKVVISGGQKGKPDEKVDLNALYPIFWNLQSFFSTPTKMFDTERFVSFKIGMEATLNAFKNINTELENKTPARSSDEAIKSHKRKRMNDGAEFGTSFNPKYLTSRDLFDLEVSDTAFRRHVLVQALILLDFMLSLTSQAKTRSTDLTNKSVLYGFTLSDDDAKWVANMRKSIEGYLADGLEGKFYYRMVDTVLSRDRNWVRWKAEGCPPIEQPAIPVPEYMKARNEASKIYTNKRLRPTPMGSLDLKFLSDAEALANVERLKESDRFTVPTADSFMMGIMDDEMDIDMAQTPDDKNVAIISKASKTWRVLRLAAKSRLSAFDKIEDGNNLKALFEAPAPPADTPPPTEANQGAENGETTEHDSKDFTENTEEAQEPQEPQEAQENQEPREPQETTEDSKPVTENPHQELEATSKENPATDRNPGASSALSGDDAMKDSTT
ncbi:hypothetical protein N7478_008707 [Penicillium angulare]|uniref:uncharacterized protein n=1 Tax=Penicillium angulare TaxID=116970 RepID=UPI0025405975|nr:uncharacterized protein N7478_008707 [Penicillium angulare]KAJ5273582.1 hypothetical protein N7478_008707 [Penicillium angulare]